MKTGSSLTSRRQFLRAAALAATGSALAGCGVAFPAPASAPASKEPIRLVYQDWRTNWFPALAEEMLGQFHELHPDIRVFYTPDPEPLEENMIRELESGTAADVFAGCCAFFPAWAQKGHTLDLRSYVEGDLDEETIAEWSEAQYKAFFTPNGEQFALPKYHGGLALYYNKDMFAEAGVEEPEDAWTYDEYLDAMLQLTAFDTTARRWGSMIDVSWDRIQIHVNGFGGHFVNPDDSTRCEMAAEASLEAHEWLRARMWDDKVMATALDVEKLETRQAFIQQKIAMVEDGSWALKDILSEATFEVGVMPFPIGPVRHVTLATTDGFAIYSRTRYPDAAWELMKFLTGPDYGRAMARVHFLQPARASLVPDWVNYIREQYPEKTENMNIAAFADGHTKAYSVTTEIFPNMLDVTTLSRETWDRIFTLGQSPVSDLSQLCKQIEEIQQQASRLPAPCDCDDKV